jgi:8-oxo-dGTP pyrophosphatase MutT (NUDIX family)
VERTLATDVPISSAATVMLLRDGQSGLEVLMLQRTLSAAFARGQFVFPGGRVDHADHGVEFEPVCDVIDDIAASRRLGVPTGGLAWLVAAIRECFEEAGVLLARRADESHVVRFDDPDTIARFEAHRHAVHTGQRSLVDVCVDERLLLLVDRLQLVDRWLTPLGERRRFDTRFFVAPAPESQTPLHDDGETIASRWIRPHDALEAFAAGELQMFPPTVMCLRRLTPHATVAAALEAASAVGVPPLVEPRLVLSDDERVLGVRLAGDDLYESTPIPRYVIGNPR